MDPLDVQIPAEPQFEMMPYPRVQALIDLVGEWINHRREMANANNCDNHEFELIARDLGVSTAELKNLVRLGQHSADELLKLMKVLDLDADAIACTRPHLMTDMVRVCSHCSCKRRCNRDFAAGTLAQHYSEYCRSAVALRSLGEQLPPRSAGPHTSVT